MRVSSLAALAVSPTAVASDERVQRDVRKALLRGAAEVTFWGELPPIDVDCRIDQVEHRLSGVARAFKSQALIATSTSRCQAEPTEKFQSAAMWYPLDSPDLTPILRW